MKKAWIIAALTLFIGLMSFAYADTGTHPVYGKNMPELKITAEQKATLISLKTQLLEVKKQIVRDNVKNGTITQEQGKLIEAKINSRIEALKAGKLGPDHHKHSPRCKRVP